MAHKIRDRWECLSFIFITLLNQNFKRMNYNKIIAHNIRMRKLHKEFPRLPKIVKFNEKTKKYGIQELNPGHTESVFRGYLKRLNNFNKHSL